MGNKINLAGKICDESILLENGIFVNEVQKTLEPVKKQIILAQGFTLGKFSLHMGQYFNMGNAAKDKYCLYFSGRSFDVWFNEKNLEIDYSENHGMPFNYHDCEVSRVVSPSRQILYENEESIKRWNKEFNEWKEDEWVRKNDNPPTRFFHMSKIITNLISLYGLNVRI